MSAAEGTWQAGVDFINNFHLRNQAHSSVPTHTGFCFGRRGGKLPRPFSQVVTAMAISSSDRVASSSSYEEWTESLTR